MNVPSPDHRFDGTVFLALMRQHGYATLNAISAALGCDRRTVRRWISGENTPRWEHVAAIERVVGHDGIAQIRGQTP